MGPFLTAVARGFPAKQVLKYVSQRLPQYANYINAAQIAGYHANQILKSIDKSKESPANADAYLTPNEKIRKRAKTQKTRERLGTVGAAGLAAGVGYLAMRGRRGGAVNPTQIQVPGRPQIPPQGPRQGPTINITPNQPRGGGGAPGLTNQTPRPWNRHSTQVKPNAPLQLTNQQRQLTQKPPIQPTAIQPRPQKPGIQTPEVIAPPFEHDPQTNVNLIKNLKEDKRIAQAVTSGLAPAAIMQVLRESIPKSKLALLDRAEGGFEQAINDFTQYKQHEIATQQSEEKRLEALAKFNQKESLAKQELDRFNKAYPKPLIQEQEIDEELEPEIEEQIPEEQTQQNIPFPSVGSQESNIQNRVKEAALSGEKAKSISQTKEINPRSFSIPNYLYPGETKEEFNNRKVLFDAINKASHALLAGKSFLDFPINPEAIKARGGYSTAADVLRYMANIPNIYDPLLDDEEKEELTSALLESGQMTTPGLAPTPGERNIHGAQLTPNLIWNLLLTVEPRLSSIEKPPSVKGYKMAPGKKMGTAELRRFLTHSVYGVLSGRTISSELADKIGKISNATASLDTIIKATKAGNQAKVEAEMERLARDDEYFLELMDIELENLILSPESREKQRLRDIEDTKGAAALKAAATRKKNKEEPKKKLIMNSKKLYHTSPEEIKEIHKEGTFGSQLFFSETPYSMSVNEPLLYELEANEQDFLDPSKIPYLKQDEFNKIDHLVIRIEKMLKVDKETALDLISEKYDISEYFNRLDPEDNEKEFDFLKNKDLGEASWEIQKLTGLAANILGYKGAKLKDEQGTSYIIDMFGKEKELKRVK